MSIWKSNPSDHPPSPNNHFWQQASTFHPLLQTQTATQQPNLQHASLLLRLFTLIITLLLCVFLRWACLCLHSGETEQDSCEAVLLFGSSPALQQRQRCIRRAAENQWTHICTLACVLNVVTAGSDHLRNRFGRSHHNPSSRHFD